MPLDSERVAVRSPCFRDPPQDYIPYGNQVAIESPGPGDRDLAYGQSNYSGSRYVPRSLVSADKMGHERDENHARDYQHEFRNSINVFCGHRYIVASRDNTQSVLCHANIAFG